MDCAFANPLTKISWGFKIKTSSKGNALFSLCNLAVFHTVRLWGNSQARKECSQQHIFTLKLEKKNFKVLLSVSKNLSKETRQPQLPWTSPLLCCFIWPLCPDAAAWNKQDSSTENIPLQWFLNVTQLILFYCCCYFLTPISMLADVQNIDKVPLCIPSNLYIVWENVVIQPHEYSSVYAHVHPQGLSNMRLILYVHRQMMTLDLAPK